MVTMTVMPSGHNFMGTSMVQWFIYCLVVSLFAAYLASRAVGRGAPYLEVSRFASTTAATLRVGRKAFRIGPKARRITIALPASPKLGPLAVRYSVTARGVRQRVIRDRMVVVRA